MQASCHQQITAQYVPKHPIFCVCAEYKAMQVEILETVIKEEKIQLAIGFKYY